MKKFISVLLVLTLCLCLGGCKEETPAEPFAIESYEWEFSMIQDETGTVVYCSKKNAALYPDAQILELGCDIKNNAILLEAPATDQNWSFAYEVYMDGPSGTIYNVTVPDTVALASVNLTEYDDGTSAYTLTLAADRYALYFYEK
ncbi:MAG: hypothetical protein IJ407_03995 [Clostridia bacterium]|nr:hypothetical protein [Clostridia bacterium]